MNMPTISQLLQYILSKRYGEEVRGAIRDAIEKCYQDVNSATLREDAFKAALQAAIDHGDIPGMVVADNSISGAKIQDGTIPLRKLSEAVQITVDSALSDSSTNPVQNKVIKGAIDELNGSLEELELTVDTMYTSGVPANVRRAIYALLAGATYNLSGFTEEKEIVREWSQGVPDSITAVYTQSGSVYTTSTLESLKNDLVVLAVYADSTSETVDSDSYTLSGTLVEGISTITVRYMGMTTTFTVTVGNRSAYLMLDDIVESTGFTGLSVSAEGSVSETSVVSYGVLEMNKNILPVKMYLSGGGNKYNIIFAKNEDGTYYGSDPQGHIFKFTKSGSKYNAESVSNVTERTVAGSLTSGQTFIANMTNGVLTITTSTGSVSFTNANAFGIWMSNVNIANPTNCEVNYNGSL